VKASAWRVAAISGAALVAAAALGGPADRLADTFFAWHMAQHLVVLFAVPLLLVLARPFDWFARFAGKRYVATGVRLLRPMHALASVPVAFSIFVASLWLTHYSGLYEAALEHPLVHAFEHAAYLCAGTILWLPVVAPAPLRPPAFPVRLLYLFILLPQGALLGAALDTSHVPLYAHYVAALGVAGALADQRNAAAVMWIGGGMTILGALLVTAGVWAYRETRALRDSGYGGPRLAAPKGSM
jgi:putative membrane protein